MRRQSVLRAEERKHCSRVMDQAACDAVWGTTSNRLGAETAARTGIPEQARKHPSRGKVARGRSGAIGRISYFDALRAGASKPCIYNRISSRQSVPRDRKRAGCAGADREKWIAGCEIAS